MLRTFLRGRTQLALSRSHLAPRLTTRTPLTHQIFRHKSSTPRGNPEGSTPPPKGPPKVDSTLFFRLTNPELFMDTSSPRTWALVGFIWVCFGSYGFYLYRQEVAEQEELDTIESLKNQQRQMYASNEPVYGPQRPPSQCSGGGSSK